MCQLDNLESASMAISPLESLLIEIQWFVIGNIWSGGFSGLSTTLFSKIRHQIHCRLFNRKLLESSGDEPTPQGEDDVSNLKVGEIVKVLSQEEILATLDNRGKYQRLGFMEEMYKFCGKKYRVLKRIDRMMVEGKGLRRIRNTVILEGVFCDGQHHGGCQRTCYCIWREGWLRRVE